MRDRRAPSPLVVMALASALLLPARLASATPQENAPQETDLAKLADDYFSPLAASKRISAAAVVVVDKEKPIFERAYGPVDLERSIWRTASVSKALIALAVMQLVEQGKLDLDADVNRYLKSFQVPATFPEPITLRQLLEHRSGLDDRFIGDGFKSGRQPPMSMLMKQVLPTRVYAPGEVESYSNYGYGLIGAVIEDVSGERFEAYVDTHVLRPLGMNRSTFEQPLAQDAASATVSGNWWYQHAAPAGGLATTARDMAVFLVAALRDDAPLISKASFQAMTLPQTKNSGLVHRLGYWTGNDRGHQIVGASGDSGTFHNVLAAVPDQGIGVVVLVSGRGGSLAWGFYSRFLDNRLGPRPAQPMESAPLLKPREGDRERCARFSGFYRTVRYPHHELSKTFILLDLTRVTVEHDGALRFNGSRWIQTAPLQFQKEDGSDTVAFKEDSQGRIKYLAETEEKIAWYETGYVNIGFYFLFTIFFAVASWRVAGVLQWLCAGTFLHSIGWLTLVLLTGPENLIFGLPLALKALLWIGNVVPLLAILAVYAALRNRTIYRVACAVVMVCYIPFVFYWNLHA